MKTKLIALILLITTLVTTLFFTGCGKKYEFIFDSNGDGTCSVSINVEYLRDARVTIVIPDTSPDGDKVTGIVNVSGHATFIKDVVLPDTIEFIYQGAFSGCEHLESINFPEGLTTIAAFAFNGCKSLTEVTIPDTVKSIGRYAFQDCEALAKIVIGGGIIEPGVFYGCESLQSVVIGKNVSGGDDPSALNFNCQNIESITVDPANETYYSEQNCLIVKEGKILIDGCKNSIIPDGVKIIGDGAFYDSGITGEIVIPDSVEYIHNRAFENTEITSVIFGRGLKHIGEAAFCYCTGLTEISIPANVRSISKFAFTGCDNIKSFELENKNWYCDGNTNEPNPSDFSSPTWNVMYFTNEAYSNYSFRAIEK